VSDINELIKKKLELFPSDVAQLAMEALKLSETGLAETSISEALASVVRKIVKAKEGTN